MLSVLAAAVTASTVITNADATVTTYSHIPSHRGERPALVVTNTLLRPNGTLTTIPTPLYRSTHTLDEYAETEKQRLLIIEQLRSVRDAMRTNGAPRSANHTKLNLLNRPKKGQPHAAQPKD